MPGVVPLEELNLPVRAYNSLRRVGIHSVGELSARTEGELLAIENLGPQSVREIKQRLADVGLRLASQPQDGRPATAAGPATATGTGAASGGSAAAAGSPAASVAAAQEPWADGAASRDARPPDEDAIDLLSVAGFPVLKRALPVVGVIVTLLVVFGILRRGRRRAART
jgi:hypothetical protein